MRSLPTPTCFTTAGTQLVLDIPFLRAYPGSIDYNHHRHQLSIKPLNSSLHSETVQNLSSDLSPHVTRERRFSGYYRVGGDRRGLIKRYTRMFRPDLMDHLYAKEAPIVKSTSHLHFTLGSTLNLASVR